MSECTKDVRKAIDAFLDAYLGRRSLPDMLEQLASQIQWVGTGRVEVAAGREEVEQLLRDDFAISQEGYEYDCEILKEQILPSGDVLLLTRLCASQDGITLETRMTLLYTLEEGIWKLASMHCSTPEAQQDSGTYFPTADDGLDPSDFARQVGTRTLDLLEKNIAGGILGVYMEPGFPIYYVNSRMLEVMGYQTMEEFLQATRGLFIQCIPREDWEETIRKVEIVSAGKQEFEIQYRIIKRDGSKIWVNDMGRNGIAEDGRALCISVVRDITEERERQRQLQREAEESARQARRYDQLFQSVLCGIVQYHLHEDGKVSFENANREAIRIFGYKPEEFWAKQDWDMANLAVEEDRERVLGEIGELKNLGDKRLYEYRVHQKDGKACWIVGSAEILLNSEGKRVVQSVFLDINERKQTEQRNRLLTEQVEASNELLRLALEHTATCECYYYPQSGLLRLPKRTREYYHTAAEYAHMPESFAEDRVEEADREDFLEMFHLLQEGERAASVEFRVRDTQLWCRATFSVIPDVEEGKSELVVGILEDISRQKQMEQALEETHTRDSLTGLYNRETGVQLVQECLRQRAADECHAMFLLDMDDFERINTEIGTAFADALLQEVADILNTELGDRAICVRLGGDEFMVLIRNCNKAGATVIGPRIAGLVRNVLIQPEQNIPISVSIGMCVTDVTEEYSALYRCAESTLRYVKEHRKGTAACYLDTSNDLGVMLTQIYTDAHAVNSIERISDSRENDLISFALELLSKSRNLDDAVFLLLSRVGKNLGLDRVTIFEVNREFLSYRITYQWARNRSDLQIGEVRYLARAELELLTQMYDEEGLADGKAKVDISTIASCLHAGIWNYGAYMGAMSFEIDVENYSWNDQQRKLLKELVKIIASFLMKAKADTVSKAKTEFLSRMSHEIRTPMNAISGMTTIAKSVLGDPEKTLNCLEKIEAANGYLLELINDILDMSRIESGKMSLNVAPLNLVEQLDRLETLLNPQAQAKHLELRFENDYRSNRPVMGDELRLNQVLINIIGNAIKFTPEGGHILVRVETLALEPRVRLRFSVKDDGIGIEESALERIFNAFEQANSEGNNVQGGTGLGLAISSRLVQLMGGQLEVHSQPGEGSEFFFTLEVTYAGVEAQKQEQQESAGRADFTGLQLLVAEDNELNREIVQTILEMAGFQAVCVSDGAEAVQAFTQSNAGTYDVILMDIRMPVMDGLEATRRIRTSGHPDARTIPIIALSANAFDEDSRKSIKSGMNGHLSKPFQIEQLLNMLETCLQGQRNVTHTEGS